MATVSTPKEPAMRPIQQFTLATASVLALSFAPASLVRALPLTTSDSMTFVTEDQSLWGPGTEAAIQKPFSAKIIDIDTGSQTIGEIAELSTSIPNPAYLAWQVAYKGCRLVYSDSICRNGKTIDLGFKTITIKGLGNAPASTLSVGLGQNGLELTYDIDVEAGFEGGLTVDGGKVDVSYPTMAGLQTAQDSYAKGQLVTVKTFETLSGTPTMSTEFSDVDVSFQAYADLDIDAMLEAYLLDQGGTLPLFDEDTGHLSYELLGVSAGNSVLGLRLFGLDPIEIDTSGGLGLNVFKVTYPPCPPDAGGLACPLGIPLADFQLQVPNLDSSDSSWTPPDGTTDGKLSIRQFPDERTVGAEDDSTLFGGGAGFHPTDFAKVDVDIDGIISAATISATGFPLIFGLTASLPVPGLISVEGNLIDFDLGAFFGFGQELTFEPNLMSELNFSVPIEVESKTTPGLFEEVSKLVLDIGEDFNFIHPGVDVQIDPTYYLENSFTNLTNLLISPVASLSVLQLKLLGLIPAGLGIDFDAALFQQVFPLVDPIVAASIGSTDPFALEGFNRVQGSALFLKTAQASVPEPSALALLFIGLLMLAWARQRRALAHAKPNPLDQ